MLINFSYKKIFKYIFFIFILCFIVYLYIFIYEPNNLQKTYLVLETSLYPVNQEPLKIIHLTDFHIDKIGYREKKVLIILKEENPDIIFLTGDYLNDRSKTKDLTKYIKKIKEIAPVYFTLGNWDNYEIHKAVLKGGAKNVFEKFITVNYLDFNFNLLSIKYSWAYIGEDRERNRMRELLSNKHNDYYTILLAHTPDHFPVAIENNLDLVLAGHTHGGQIRLPIIGSFYTDSKFGKKYEKGYFKDKDTIMYVNRGIGMTGNIKYRIRSFCPPEILIITIKSIQS